MNITTKYKDPNYTVGNIRTTVPELFNQLPAIFNKNWLNDVFDSSFERAFDLPNVGYPYNVKFVKDTEKNIEKYVVEVALAGIGKENIDVKVREGYLHIEVLKDENEQEANTSYVKKGISKRKTKLSFALSENTDVKNISSTYTDGLLRVTVPVRQPEVFNVDIKVD